MEREILRKLVELINKGHVITLEADDFGENTLTLHIDDLHTHCGVPDGSFDDLVESLYELVVNGRGLSFARS